MYKYNSFILLMMHLYNCVCITVYNCTLGSDNAIILYFLQQYIADSKVVKIR